MADKKFTVVLIRTVRETLTLTIGAASRQHALVAAGMEYVANIDRIKWEPAIGPMEIASVEIAKPEPADPPAIPPLLVRSKAGP